MCAIETQIWEPVPDKKGYVRYVGQRKLQEVFSELEEFLKKENIYPDEYLLLTRDNDPEALFPKGDIRCYAQWGGSEGIYLELEVLTAATKEDPAKWVNVASGKTLAQTAEAYDRMQYIAGRIYKAFCGDNFQSPRYIILDNKGEKEISYERLMSKLETELSDYMKHELLHKRTPVGELSRKLGFMLTILSVIREPRAYADLPQDKIEQLYDTENILEILCDMCSSVSEADLFEISDIIASAPSFVQDRVEQPVEKEEPSDEYYNGFTHFQRMKYNDIPHSEFVDQVTFGLYARSGGCLSEASVLWTHLNGRIVPYIRVFEDGIKAAFSTRFLAVVDKLRTMGDFTPGQLSHLLIEQGFEDDSDTPLADMDNVKYLRLKRKDIENYERLMKLPKDHPDLEDFPKYALIKSWEVKFDNPRYVMEIKICSSGYADPLWSEAILLKDGKQIAYTEPESDLSGDWTLLDNGAEFTVFVVPEEGLSHSEKVRGRIDFLKKKAQRIGGNFKHSFFDDRHLDCFWYDGKDYATIEYRGYTICFDVCGDVQATIVCDRDINEEGFIEICHRDGAEPLYFRTELKGVLEDDTALNLYRQLRATEIEAQNWVNIIIKCQATGEYVCEPAASEFSNVLDAVENAFDPYIKHIDDMIAEMGGE